VRVFSFFLTHTDRTQREKRDCETDGVVSIHHISVELYNNMGALLICAATASQTQGQTHGASDSHTLAQSSAPAVFFQLLFQLKKKVKFSIFTRYFLFCFCFRFSISSGALGRSESCMSSIFVRCVTQSYIMKNNKKKNNKCFYF
jgi:hypothetical protein